MKRHLFAFILIAVISAPVSACTVGSSSGGTNPSVPGPPSGGATHMYLSSIGGANGIIYVYQLPVTSSSTPVAAVTTIAGPMQLFVDKSGRLFVPFLGSNLIWVYNTPLSASSTPTMILNTKSQNPEGVTEDSNGNVFAGLANSNCCIDVFPAPISGGQTASTEITWNSVNPHGLSFVRGIATDSSNNIYISSDTSIIQMTPPLTAASTPSQNVPTPLGFLYDIVLDGSNNVYVANGTTQGTIDVYHPPFTSASSRAFGVKIPGAPYLEGLAIDPSGNLWVTEPGNNVWEIAAPLSASSVPQKILTGILGPWGIVFGP